MAKVIASLAELRGKLGGTIWQRTKAGLIVKGYTRPVDVQTSRQRAARVRIGTASRMYAALSESERTQWAQFAGVDGLFVPRSAINKGQFTGQQAFVALKSAIMSQADALRRIVALTFGGQSITPVQPQLQTNTPPARRLDGRLSTLSGPYPLVLRDLIWLNSTTVQVHLQLVGAEAVPSISIPAGALRDGQDGAPIIRISAALVVSDAIGQGALSTTALSWARAIPLWPWGDLAGVATATYGSIDVVTVLSDRSISDKYGLIVGKRYTWSLWLTDNYGNQAFAGSVIAPLNV